MPRRTLAAALLAASACTAPAYADDFALTGVIAWPMTGTGPVENATIVVRGDRIETIRSGGAVPAGMTAYALPGAVVTPGLFNAATQIGLVELSSDGSTRDMTSAWDGASSGFDISYAVTGTSTIVALARADGLTGALVYPGPSKKMPFAGQAAVLKLREGDDVLDRSLAALVTYIGGTRWHGQADSRAAQWEALYALFDGARHEHAGDGHGGGKHKRGHGDEGAHEHDDDHDHEGDGGGGGDGRGHFGGGPDRLDKEALEAVLDKRAPLVIFTDRESDLRQAIAFKARFDIAVVVVGAAQGWRVAPQLAAAHIPVVITPSQDLPTSYDELGSRLDNAAILDRAGVEVLFGQAGGVISNTFNAGLALRQEAGIAVANGMARDAALKAITVAPRAVFGERGEDGTLAEGKGATLVVWDGDPLEPSSLVTRMFIDGRPVALDTRQDLLARKYAGK